MEEANLVNKIEDLGKEITSIYYKRDGKLSCEERTVLLELTKWFNEMVDFAAKKEKFDFLKKIWNEEVES